MTTNFTRLLRHLEASGWSDDQFEDLLASWNWNEPVHEVDVWKVQERDLVRLSVHPALWAVLHTRSPRLIQLLLTPERQGRQWEGQPPVWKELMLAAVGQGQPVAVEKLLTWPNAKDATWLIMQDDLWTQWTRVPEQQVALLRRLEPYMETNDLMASRHSKGKLRQLLRLKVAQVWLALRDTPLRLDIWQACFPKWSKAHQDVVVACALLHGRIDVPRLYADDQAILATFQTLFESKGNAEKLLRSCGEHADAGWVSLWVEACRRLGTVNGVDHHATALEQLAYTRPDDPQWATLAPASYLPSVREWVHHGEHPTGLGYRTRLSQGHVLSPEMVQDVLDLHWRTVEYSSGNRVDALWARIEPGVAMGLFTNQALSDFAQDLTSEQQARLDQRILDHAVKCRLECSETLDGTVSPATDSPKARARL